MIFTFVYPKHLNRRFDVFFQIKTYKMVINSIETVGYALKECPLHLTKFTCMRKEFSKLDLKALINTKKGFGTTVKFLALSSRLFC